MKKLVLAMALFFGVSTMLPPLSTAAPRHRTHVVQQHQDATDDAADEGIEAYSDTVAADTVRNYDNVDDDASSADSSSVYSLSHYSDPLDYLGNVCGKSVLVFFVFMAVLLGLLFILAPFIIAILLIRYLVRRHNDRVKLAEMAMDKGQNIPESARPIDRQSSGYLIKRGVRNVFIGMGLCVMFLIWESTYLAGIGAFLAFYGLGQVVIAVLPHLRKLYHAWMDRKDDITESSQDLIDNEK